MREEAYMDGFDLTRYPTNGVHQIVRDAIRATVRNPRESAFLMRYAKASREAVEKRAAALSHAPFRPIPIST